MKNQNPFATFGPEIETINERPAVELPRQGRLVSDFADELGAILGSTGEIYSRRGIPFAVNTGDQRLEPVTAPWLQTWVERHVTPYLCKESKNGGEQIKICDSMKEPLARTVLASPMFAAHLPPVARFNPCPMPVCRKDGRIELLPEGYDPESETVTASPGFSIAQDMDIDKGRLVLDDVLYEFPFAADAGRSRAVALAAMLSVFAAGLLPHGSLRPVIIFLANAEGAGKTLLASLAGIPYRELAAEAAPKDESEWQKKILAAVIAGKRILLLDNVRGHLASAALEAYTTSPVFSGRILGVSKEFAGEAGASVLITGNSLTVSPDLRRRALFVELFMSELRAEERKFRRTLDASELARLRPKIIAALWALVRHWDTAGRPPASHGNASFPRWAEIIGGIIEAAGYGCPTRPAEIEGMGDTDTADFAELAAAMNWGKRYEFAELVTICEEAGLFERILTDRDKDGGLSRAGKRALSSVLKRYDRRRVSPEISFRIEGKGHSRRYLCA